MMLMLITTTPPRAVAAGSPGGLHLKAEPLRLIDRINERINSPKSIIMVRTKREEIVAVHNEDCSYSFEADINPVTDSR